MESVRITKTQDGASMPPKFNLYMSNFEFQSLYSLLEYYMSLGDEEHSDKFDPVTVNCLKRLWTDFFRANY